MKRFQWATAILLVAFAQCAYADSVSNFKITQVTAVVLLMWIATMCSSVSTGPGTNITGVGGTICPDHLVQLPEFSSCQGPVFTQILGKLVLRISITRWLGERTISRAATSVSLQAFRSMFWEASPCP